MLTDAEFNALVLVLQRAPATPAEIPYLQMVMEKLRPAPPAQGPDVTVIPATDAKP